MGRFSSGACETMDIGCRTGEGELDSVKRWRLFIPTKVAQCRIKSKKFAMFLRAFSLFCVFGPMEHVH